MLCHELAVGADRRRRHRLRAHPDGERVIGSWQAGDAEAGLAFYTRRYEDLATEVTLLEQRLMSGAADPATTRAHATELAETAAHGGRDRRPRQPGRPAGRAAASRRRRRPRRRWPSASRPARAAIDAKEALIAEAEQIADASTSWKVSGDRLRAIVEEWKTIRGIDRRTDDALWKRFAAARDAFSKRRGQHFAQLDAERGTARAVKEKLVARAEELSTSSDWKETAAAMRDLMTEWKAAGRASRDVEDALWQQFRGGAGRLLRAPVGRPRRARRRAGDQPAAQGSDHPRSRAGSTSPIPKAAQATLRELQARYDDIGHVPREAMRRPTTGCAPPSSGSGTPSTRSGAVAASSPTRSSPSCGPGWPRPKRSWPEPGQPVTRPASRGPRPRSRPAGR